MIVNLEYIGGSIQGGQKKLNVSENKSSDKKTNYVHVVRFFLCNTHFEGFLDFYPLNRHWYQRHPVFTASGYFFR